jgi:hypothetical protein
MVTDARKLLVLVLMLCLCVSIFIPVVTARDAFAPSWLKEGAYVKYEHSLPGTTSLGAVGFFNLSNPKFAGTNYVLSGQKLDAVLETNSSSLVWRCESVNDTMAKLQVTLDYVGTPPSIDGSSEEVSVQRTAEVYVDLYTRGVYNFNGTFLGTTHLWLPANPDNGQEITIWEENSETVTSPVTTTSDSWTTTVQGNQDIFQTDAYVTIKNNPYLMLNLYCDLDTGLSLGIIFWDPVFAAVGIANGPASVSETNINLGPERSTINWNQIMYYSIIPIAIILLVVTLLIKRRRKKN